MYWLAIGSYCKPVTLAVGSQGPMPAYVEQSIWRETGEPGAKMLSPRLEPRLNFTGIVSPAFVLFRPTGGKNPLNGGGAPIPRKYSPLVLPSPVTRRR